MQTQTRRLEKIALLATRQEAEFVSGVLDAADVPHAIVDVSSGLELRVDPDDAPRVRELIDRLDVKNDLADSSRQRRGEAQGRRLVAAAAGGCLFIAGSLLATNVIGVPRVISGGFIGLLLAIPGAALLAVAIFRKPRR